MKMTTKIASILLLFLAVPFLLLPGCGTDLVKSQGCPSGSYLANSTDTITGPADSTFVGSSALGAPFGGGSILPTPVTFTVTDASGEPRNNICLTLYTGDTAGLGGPFWFTDVSYGTLITGTGPLNFRTVATNDSGVAILYWTSGILPAGNPRILTSAGPPPTYSAGGDQTGTSYIQVYSGTQQAIFNVNWTVKGEPAS